MTEGNSKPLYNYLRNCSGRSNNITSIKDEDSSNIPNALADHFASVYNKITHPTPEFSKKNYPPMESFDISKEGVKALIMKIDIRKCEGPDDLPGIAIKY